MPGLLDLLQQNPELQKAIIDNGGVSMGNQQGELQPMYHGLLGGYVKPGTIGTLYSYENAVRDNPLLYEWQRNRLSEILMNLRK